MPSIDMPLEQLRQYKPGLYRESDFESFWESTTAEALKQPIHAELIPYDLRTKGLVCYAVRFDGFKGADKQQQGGRIAGWYVRPEAGGKFPGVCIYHGYGGRGPRRSTCSPSPPRVSASSRWTAAARTANRRTPPSTPRATTRAG